MSRSTNTELANPCTRWFEWSGSEGKLKYYDKDNQKNIFVDIPFTFLVLDQLNTITGWSDDAQSGIWANEVRDLRTEELTVRTKQGILGKGPYDQVKNLNGARFTKSVYIAYYDDKDLKLGHLKIVGSSLGSWIEFTKGKNLYSGAVTLSGNSSAKKGTNKYFVPEFEMKEEVSYETETAAKELDKELQKYLKAYFAKSLPEVPDAYEWEEMNLEVDSEPFSEESLAEAEKDEIPF